MKRFSCVFRMSFGSHTHARTQGTTPFVFSRARPSLPTPPFAFGVWSNRDPQCPPFLLGRVSLVTNEVLVAKEARVIPECSAPHVPAVVQLDPWCQVRGVPAKHCREALPCPGQDQMSLTQPPAAATSALKACTATSTLLDNNIGGRRCQATRAPHSTEKVALTDPSPHPPCEAARVATAGTRRP